MIYDDFSRIFYDFLGQYGLQTASEVRSDLRFEISDLDYLHIHVHIAYMFWARFEALLVASEATITSEVKSDIRLGIYGSNFIWYFNCLDSSAFTRVAWLRRN